MKTQEIRTALKERLGYNSRQVSVKERAGGLSYSFTLTIRDASVNEAQVEELARSLQSVDRCEYTGEILGGGNTYLNVRISPEVEAAWSSEYIEEVNSALEGLNQSAGTSVEVIEGFSLIADEIEGCVRVICGRGSVRNIRGRFSISCPENISLFIYRESIAL